MSDEEMIYPKSEQLDGDYCYGCGNFILDRYLLKVNGNAWHAKCLRCCMCESALEKMTSCYTRGDNIYCKSDYAREFGTKCSKCSRIIQSSDWVRRAKEHVYHLACFACDSCKRQLSTGEEFALQDSRVLCKTHYQESIDGDSGDKSPGSDGLGKSKTKRVRTTFTDEQLQVLQANFSLDSNPDGQDLERIAQITGLSKRVTQVWFQNSRARQKKHQQGQNGTRKHMNQHRSVSPNSVLSGLPCSMSSPSLTPPGIIGQRIESPHGCGACGMLYCTCMCAAAEDMTSVTDSMTIHATSA